jgi:alkylation response protein AidB-like acyl-CoA dehydrogenase
MELMLSPEQAMLTETSRKFLLDRAGATTLRALRHHPVGYEADYWRMGCELGWTSLLVSEDDGGGSVSGESLSDLVLVAYEFGRQAAPGPLITTNVVADTLSRSGSAEQKAVLQGILAGESVAAWAFGEPTPNDRLGAVTLQATAHADSWRLDGIKAPVEGGPGTAQFLVTARMGEGLSQFLVPADTPGLTVTPMETVDLTRRFSSVRFEGVSVPQSSLVGHPGGAAGDVERQLQVANIVQVAEMVGSMSTVFDMTVEWAFNRYSFGRPLASYQELKHRFADMKTWLEASHGLSNAATRAVQDGSEDAPELVSAAKAYVGQFGPELCHDCVQMHGGIGVTFDHDLHLYLRRVVLNAATYGTVLDHRLRLTGILEEREMGDAA